VRGGLDDGGEDRDCEKERGWRKVKGKMDDAEKMRVMERWRRGKDGGEGADEVQ